MNNVWFLDEELFELNSEDIIDFLSKKHNNFPKPTIIEYCNKIGFDYVNFDLNNFFIYNEEIYKKYLDLVSFINKSILEKDKKRIEYIESLFDLPEINLSYQISDLPSHTSYGEIRECLKKIIKRISENKKLDESFYKDLDIIFESNYPYIDKETRDSIISSIDDNYKKHYLSKNILKIFEKYKNNKSFVPRLNGIPLNSCAISEEVLMKVFTDEKDIKKGFLSNSDIYAIMVFVKIIPYFHSFLVPDFLKKRVLQIESSCEELDCLNKLSDKFDTDTILDFQQHENNNTNNDNEQNHISKEFLDSVIKKIPEDYNNLEKIIYIYYYLCYILTYDNEYYTNRNTEKNLLRKNMFNVNEKNNEVVCFQFTSVLKDFADYLKIKNYGLLIADNAKFRRTHQFLNMFVDGLVIEADSTRAGADGDDLAFVKMGIIGKGIRCKMYNTDLQKKFLSAKEKVSKRIINDFELKYYEEIKEDMQAYNNLSNNVGYRSLTTKFKLLFFEIKRLNPSRIDALALFDRLFKKIFNNKEKKYISYQSKLTKDIWGINIVINYGNTRDYIYFNLDNKTVNYYNNESVKQQL